jgi:hypothetical protein
MRGVSFYGIRYNFFGIRYNFYIIYTTMVAFPVYC